MPQPTDPEGFMSEPEPEPRERALHHAHNTSAEAMAITYGLVYVGDMLSAVVVLLGRIVSRG